MALLILVIPLGLEEIETAAPLRLDKDLV